MTDDRLREAEREFGETGSVSAEARLLLVRVRAGTLARERIEVAAALHHDAALLVLDRPRQTKPHSVHRIMEALEPFGQEVVVRAALVPARRCAALGRAREYTGECIAAIEAWLACPCERHRREVETFLGPPHGSTGLLLHEDARFAAERVFWRDRRRAHPHARAQSASSPHEPDAALAAAIRRELTSWALAPHELGSQGGATKGSMLDLRVGCAPGDHAQRILVSEERVSLGAVTRDGIHLDLTWGNDCEIARTDEGYELRNLLPMSFVYVNERRIERALLATGDVIGLGATWVEVRVLDAPFDVEVERAREEAAALRRRFEDERDRIRVAAAAGHLPAVLAATRLGLGVRPRFDLRSWLSTLGDLPTSALAAASLRLARAVQPAWASVFPGEPVFERALLAVGSWLAAPSDDATRRIATTLDELRAAFTTTIVPLHDEALARGRRTRPAEDAAIAAGAVLNGCLRTITDREELAIAANAAVKANVPSELVREHISEELLRWALGE
ncbi:MAG TPA: hypothetical protein VFF73_33195 [Planctomycetota bacterium]|nr:hypothetical protein [Planctomycetota bacterium]